MTHAAGTGFRLQFYSTTLTAKRNAFGRPLAVRANAPSRSEQLETAFACVRCDGVLVEVLIVERDRTVGR